MNRRNFFTRLAGVAAAMGLCKPVLAEKTWVTPPKDQTCFVELLDPIHPGAMACGILLSWSDGRYCLTDRYIRIYHPEHAGIWMYSDPGSRAVATWSHANNRYELAAVECQIGGLARAK